MIFGYWTRMNEEWFVHRRDQLEQVIHENRKAQLDLRNAQAWRQALRYEWNRNRDFLGKIKLLSAAILTSD